MDSLTQIVLGAAVGEAVAGKKIGNKACKAVLKSIEKQIGALEREVYNKACRELYERMITAGKAKKVALVAVMNKLIK